MKNFIVIVRRGPDLNATIGSILYDRFGQKTRQHVIECDTWVEGFRSAKINGYTNALFVDSGTVFVDWKQWLGLLENYPHQGLIGHIIWHPGQCPFLHEQCWYLDLDLFDETCLTDRVDSIPAADRSKKDLHDDYTPLYIKPGSGTPVMCKEKMFGQGLIAHQLARGLPVANWNNQMRDIKHYLYPQDQQTRQRWLDSQQSYMDLAQNQLWILNNEPINILNYETLLMPGAGLYWMINIIQPNVNKIHIVDISNRQIDFVQHLWNHWDGEKYGSFVAEYVKNNQLVNFEIDRADLSAIERLKLKSPARLETYVNERFDEILQSMEITEFAERWQHARLEKTIVCHRANLVDWVLDNDITDISAAWLSNILDYKWTKLNTLQQQQLLFVDKLQQNEIKTA